MFIIPILWAKRHFNEPVTACFNVISLINQKCLHPKPQAWVHAKMPQPHSYQLGIIPRKRDRMGCCSFPSELPLGASSWPTRVFHKVILRGLGRTFWGGAGSAKSNVKYFNISQFSFPVHINRYDPHKQKFFGVLNHF